MPWNNYLDPNSNSPEKALLNKAWNDENDDLFSSWFNPGSQQQEEFAQQIVLQQMQNQWNSEFERMERMKQAGINVNTAASGISGAGASPSTSSPNSAVGAGAQGLASAAQAAGAVGDLFNSGVNAYEKFSKTPVEVEESRANIRNLLSTALHNDWLAYSISEMLPLQKSNQRADTYLKMANFEKAKEEKKLINKRIDEAQAHIDELFAQAALLEKQGNLTDALKLKTQAETDGVSLDNSKKQWDKDWRDKYGYDPNSPVDVALEQAMVNDSGDSVINAIGDSIKSVSYDRQKGFNEAEVEDAYNKFYAEFKAKADVDAEFAPYLAAIEANKQQFIELIKMIAENPSDLKGIVAKFVNLLANLGSAFSYDKSPVGTAKKPAAGYKSK